MSEFEDKAKEVGHKIEEQAKAFYLKFPFWAGVIVGAIAFQVVRWVFKF